MKTTYKILFLIYTIILFISFLILFNGFYSDDTKVSLMQITGSLLPNNWHPIAFTYAYLKPLLILGNNTFFLVLLLQVFGFWFLNLIIAKYLHDSSESLPKLISLLQIVFFAFYLLHPVQFNYPFHVIKDTPYTLIFSLCLLLFLVSKIKKTNLVLFVLPLFCYAQLLRHSGVIILFLTAGIFIVYLIRQFVVFQRVNKAALLGVFLSLTFVGLLMTINHKYPHSGWIKSFSVEAFGAVQCPDSQLTIFCSQNALKSKGCFSSSSIDACLFDQTQEASYFRKLVIECEKNKNVCVPEIRKIYLKYWPIIIKHRWEYFTKLIFHPCGQRMEIYTDHGEIVLPQFNIQFLPVILKTKLTPAYIMDTYIYSKVLLRSQWSFAVSLICLLLNFILLILFKNFINHKVRGRLFLVVIICLCGTIGFALSPIVANCYRYLWPYMSFGLTTFLITLTNIKYEKLKQSFLKTKFLRMQ